MAWTAVGDFITANNKPATSNQWASIAIGTSASIADVIVLVLATDNITAADGNSNDHTGISDTKSNTWVKQREFTNDLSGAESGATVSVWTCKITTALAAGTDTLTANFSGNLVARAICSYRFTVTSGNVPSLIGSQDLATDGGQAAAMTVGSLANAQHLWVRALATEGLGATLTLTSGYTGMVITSSVTAGGSTASNMGAKGEFIIATATTHTSDPQLASSVDHANTFLAFDEVAGGVTAALPGVAGTSGIGSIVAALTIALSGIGATASVGTISPQTSVALSGQAATGAAGAITYSADGSVTVALAGAAGTGAAGTVSPASNVSLAGAAATSSAGTVSPGIGRALSGSAGTSSAGTVSPSMARALTGVAASGAPGTIVPGETLGGTGAAATGSAGTVTCIVGGNVTATLTGSGATGSAGTITPHITFGVTVSLVGVLAYGAAGRIGTPEVSTIVGQVPLPASLEIRFEGIVPAVVTSEIAGNAEHRCEGIIPAVRLVEIGA